MPPRNPSRRWVDDREDDPIKTHWSTLEGIPVRTNKRGKPPPGPTCRPDLATCPGCLHRMGKTQTPMGWKLD